MIKAEFKLIDDNAKKFNEVAKTFVEAKQYVDEYAPIKDKAYKEMQALVKEEFNLEEIESEGKYQTLKYALSFKKASETETINKDLLKEKYPEIYKECLVVKTTKPAFLKLEEIKV